VQSARGEPREGNQHAMREGHQHAMREDHQHAIGAKDSPRNEVQSLRLRDLAIAVRVEGGPDLARVDRDSPGVHALELHHLMRMAIRGHQRSSEVACPGT
jgi:hypothetical protein